MSAVPHLGTLAAEPRVSILQMKVCERVCAVNKLTKDYSFPLL